jgi:hypothetical protein
MKNIQIVKEIICSNAAFLQKVKRLTFEFKKYKQFSIKFEKQLYNN